MCAEAVHRRIKRLVDQVLSQENGNNHEREIEGNAERSGDEIESTNNVAMKHESMRGHEARRVLEERYFHFSMRCAHSPGPPARHVNCQPVSVMFICSDTFYCRETRKARRLFEEW